MKKLGDILGRYTERLVDRATNAGHPPPAGVVVELKERGLLKPDNEVEQVTPEMLEDEHDPATCDRVFDPTDRSYHPCTDCE